MFLKVYKMNKDRIDSMYQVYQSINTLNRVRDLFHPLLGLTVNKKK